MQTVCKFTVPGQPVPWARARGGGGHGSDDGNAKRQSFYTAPAQKRAKGAVKSYGAHDMLQRRIAQMHDGRPVPLGVPLIFDCRTYLAIPSKFTRTEERAAAAGLLLPAVKPDLDNWIKLPMDALEGVAYSGDGQIVGFGGSGKWYSRTPRQEIHVYHAPIPDSPVPVDIGDLVAWFGGKPQLALEHFGPVYGDDDDQSEGWRVMRVSGSINDREWDEVGRGSTPAEAIGAARATLEKEQ